MKISIYTDGSSRGNPGNGGWGAIIISEEEVIELGGREEMTTNNKMELTGVIKSLNEIGGSMKNVKEVTVYTDSEYVKNGITKWINGWIKNGWKTSTKKPVLNQDLWISLRKEEDRIKKINIKISFEHVRGHNGNPLNERADMIATECADNANNLQLYRGPRKDYLYF